MPFKQNLQLTTIMTLIVVKVNTSITVMTQTVVVSG